jgi:hypothetical protein
MYVEIGKTNYMSVNNLLNFNKIHKDVYKVESGKT